MKFQGIIRRIHLITSMIMISFLIMYVSTGIININRSLFNIPEAEQSSYTMPVEKSLDGNPAEYGKYLQEHLGLKGRIEYRQDWQEVWIFNFNFPGDNYQVRLPPAQDSLFIQRTQQERTFFTIAHQIHVLRGFKGGWAYTAWAIMYDVSCLAMIIFALTGIIMWYRVRKRFSYGLWYLAAGLIIPATIIILFIVWK